MLPPKPFCSVWQKHQWGISQIHHSWHLFSPCAASSTHGGASMWWAVCNVFPSPQNRCAWGLLGAWAICNCCILTVHGSSFPGLWSEASRNFEIDQRPCGRAGFSPPILSAGRWSPPGGGAHCRAWLKFFLRRPDGAAQMWLCAARRIPANGNKFFSRSREKNFSRPREKSATHVAVRSPTDSCIWKQVFFSRSREKHFSRPREKSATQIYGPQGE